MITEYEICINKWAKKCVTIVFSSNGPGFKMVQNLSQYAMTNGSARARKRLTAALWITNLSSVIASNLTYIYLASFIYRQTGRIEWSNITLICPMVIPVVACFGIASITRRAGPRRIFALANGCALGITLLLLLLVSR